MKRFLCGLGIFSVLGLIAAGCTAGDTGIDGDEDEDTGEAAVADEQPTGKNVGTKDTVGQAKPDGQGKPGSGAGISLHGGPVILGTTKMYYIWYGNWSGNAAVNILTDFANNIGGSGYYNIN